MNNEKNKFLTVSWLSGLLSAEIIISTGEKGVQMPPLTFENSHFLRSGPQEATLVMWWLRSILLIICTLDNQIAPPFHNFLLMFKMKQKHPLKRNSSHWAKKKTRIYNDAYIKTGLLQ